MFHKSSHWRSFTLIPLFLGILFTIACGAAATATPVPEAPAVAPTPTKAPVAAAPTPTKVPVAAPKPTPIPVVTKPVGTLNVGQKELGRFGGHPRLAIGPNQYTLGTPPILESLLTVDANRNIMPALAVSWSLSEDFTTLTFKLRKGVQFHKGYGEMTAEDVVWSMIGWGKNPTYPLQAPLDGIWQNPKGNVQTPDPYTVVVNTGKPTADYQVVWLHTFPSGPSALVASKKQAQAIGDEAANLDMAATGSWEIVAHRTGEFWRMRAVENHWRQTPHFAELVFWEIPEESARLAGFQTGQLDTVAIGFDNIPLVEKVPGARLMRVRDTDIMTLRGPHGQFYVGIGTPKQRPSYSPDLPWVSSNPDPASKEWERARKVRLAMQLAIDRQALVDTLARGFGRADAILAYFVGYEHLLGARRWEYNPERARQLLIEAGYPDGFSITMSPGLFFLDGPVCEAVATMLQNIGIRPKLERVPYTTLRPKIIARTFQGFHCQAIPNRPLSPITGFNVLQSRNTFSFGVEHPWLEEKISQALAAVDPKERERLTAEIGQFVFDNVLTIIGVFVYDSVWPVGPRIEEWSQHVKNFDTRLMNGFEHIKPRK